MRLAGRTHDEDEKHAVVGEWYRNIFNDPSDQWVQFIGYNPPQLGQRIPATNGAGVTEYVLVPIPESH